jgi:threonine aldolase
MTEKQRIKMIDLRSDTVTKPTPLMLKAMMEAPVGDDVFNEDPSVQALEERVSTLFGMDAGLFVPSGTMSNQLGIKVLTEPGDELLIDEKGHIYNYETAGVGVLSGVQIQTIAGERGKLNPDLLANTVRGAFDWEPKTKVLCLENTTNKGGGACYSKEELIALKKFADDHNLMVHLDGARIWNAMIATGIEASFFGNIADTISVCFSKGLGAPVGSMLLSTKERIAKARRFRKMWGGGMRQVGILAAAADHALTHHYELLKTDHDRARQLAEVINSKEQFSVDLDSLETNILLFDTKEESAMEFIEKMSAHDIHMIPFGPNTVRVTFHFQISEAEMDVIMQAFNAL